MIGDKVIVQDIHWKKAELIYKEIADKMIVLIGGSSGVGKTEISECIQHLIYQKGLTSLVLSLDDFYLIPPSERNDWRKKNGLDSVGLEEIDFIDLKRIIEDFNRERPIRFRRIHRYAPITEFDKIDSSKISVILFEGLFANYLKKVDENCFSIYLEGNPTDTMEFRTLRKKENEDDPFRKKIVQKEFNICSQLKRYADLIIPFKGE